MPDVPRPFVPLGELNTDRRQFSAPRNARLGGRPKSVLSVEERAELKNLQRMVKLGELSFVGVDRMEYLIGLVKAGHPRAR